MFFWNSDTVFEQIVLQLLQKRFKIIRLNGTNNNKKWWSSFNNNDKLGLVKSKVI